MQFQRFPPVIYCILGGGMYDTPTTVPQPVICVLARGGEHGGVGQFRSEGTSFVYPRGYYAQ